LKKTIKEVGDHPERFKVCDSCNSIFPKSADLCSICGAYRFNTKKIHVLAALLKIIKCGRQTITYDDLL
jgi:rRNA maturation endonuclease Nob1